MLNNAPNLNQLWASLIVEELVRSGADAFVICPGSRSAPLATAVASGGPLTSFVHFDERGAAFFALGYARAVNRPAVLVCTSGTAVANAMPAVVEASYARVPLIVLSADRPPELLDTGANQTIDQTKLFGGFVRWQHTLPCPDLNVPPEYVLTTVDQAIHRAMSRPAGPVHLNCMFREPLAPVKKEFDAPSYTRSLASWFDGPFTRYATSPGGATDILSPALDGALTMLDQERRGILIVGQLHIPQEVRAADAIAARLGWPMLADAASGLRQGPCAARRIAFYDQLLRTRHADEFHTAPVLLHLGGAITSKTLANFIEATPSRLYLRVADTPSRLDPSHRVSLRIEIPIAEFDRLLAARLAERSPDNEWLDRIESASRRIGKKLDEFFAARNDVSEPGVLRSVFQRAPADSVVFLGNSMPIRDAEMFGPETPHALRIAANRGASGIDGNIATAIGHGAALGVPVTAVIGDLAALHDMNSLALAQTLRKPFVLVIINNDGGGIFSFLPIAEHPKHFERFFGTPHGMTFESVAKQFGLGHVQPQTAPDFDSAYATALNANAGTLIEVRTDRSANLALHRELERAIKDALVPS